MGAFAARRHFPLCNLQFPGIRRRISTSGCAKGHRMKTDHKVEMHPPDLGGASGALAPPLDLALLGHDIRSAVSDVLGGLRLIDPDPLPETSRQQVQRARVAAETLARLMDTVLQDSSLTEDGASFAPGDTDTPLLDLLDDAERRWSAHASEQALHLTVHRGPGLPAVIGVDRTSLERILSNLLSNAMKHAERGEVSFDVEMMPDRSLRFTVADQGPGFPPEVLDHLFDRGVRAKEAARQGQGMGLHICKDLADQMGGVLQVENRARGARIRFELPAQAWRLSADQARHDAECDLSGKRVLVIEDSPTNQILLRQMLARMGARVTTAGNGASGLQAWRAGGHDVALIDIELPEISGLDVIKEIRASSGPTGRLPILAVTAYVLRSNREAIFAAGADAVLAKPLSSFAVFSRSVGALLRRTGPSDPEAVRARPKSGSKTKSADPFDRYTLRHLLGIAGPQGAEELLSRLQSDLRTAQRELADGLARDDMPVIRAKTHVLVSLAGAIGARHCQEDAQQMNDAAHRHDIEALQRLGSAALARLDRLIGAVALETVDGAAVS